MSGMLRKGLLLDRDGIVNVDHGYVCRVDDWQFVPGIFDLVRAARARGHAVAIVTNQAGIGRGYYTEQDFHCLTDWMLGEFASAGAPVDRVYFCPYHPEHGLGEYRRLGGLRGRPRGLGFGRLRLRGLGGRGGATRLPRLWRAFLDTLRCWCWCWRWRWRRTRSRSLPTS